MRYERREQQNLNIVTDFPSLEKDQAESFDPQLNEDKTHTLELAKDNHNSFSFLLGKAAQEESFEDWKSKGKTSESDKRIRSLDKIKQKYNET